MTDKTTVTVHSVDYHRCTGCGKTLEHCDKRLLRHGTSCCGQCHVTDTHHNEDFDANCRRMLLFREGVDWLEAYRASRGAPADPLVNEHVVDHEGWRDVEHLYENLAPDLSDGFCRRCGRSRDHELHRCEWSRGPVGERRCRDGSTTRVRFGPRKEHEGWYCPDHADRLVRVHAGEVVPRPLTEDDVPREVWALLDRLADRPHSAGGSVRRAVLEVLTALGWRP